MYWEKWYSKPEMRVDWPFCAIVEKILEYYPFENTKDSSVSKVQKKQLFSALVKLHVHLDSGNTCLPINNLIDLFESELDLQQVFECWGELNQNSLPYVIVNNALTTKRYVEFERSIRRSLVPKITEKLIQDSPQIQSVFDILFPKEYANPQQANAAIASLHLQFMILNGGPGTGKTYTIARILTLLLCQNSTLKLALTAPTGKAAQKLSEAISAAKTELSKLDEIRKFTTHILTNAITIHRLMGAKRGVASTRKSHDNLLDLDVLIIDEFSMVDTAMFAKLIGACPETCKIILVGDAAQLPSVEAGNLLSDLIKSKRLKDNVFTLKSNHRSSNEINELAHVIHTGQLAQVTKMIPKESIFLFPDTSNEEHIVDDTQQVIHKNYMRAQRQKIDAILCGYRQYLESEKDPLKVLKYVKTFRILAPTHQGESGVEALNRYALQYLFPESSRNIGHYYHGQVIVITQNDSQTGLANGDIGVVVKNGSKGVSVFIDRYESEALELSLNRLPPHKTAFAMTIHKTQGSEFDSVLLVLPIKPVRGLNRELLYTAVTRAKSKLDVLTSYHSLKTALETTNKRDTNLRWLLDENR